MDPMQLNVRISQEADSTVISLLERILEKLDRMEQKENQFMATAAQALTDLQTAVAADTSIDSSAVTLIQNLAAAVQAANGVSPAAVEALVAQLQSNAGSLAAAVTANTTPPAPAPAVKPAS